MSKIKCNQKKCKYNNYEHCMKEGIKVDEKADCKSYEEGQKIDNSKFEFATFESLRNIVKCNATECLYNRQKNCTVENLNIGRNNNSAPCVDFKKNN